MYQEASLAYFIDASDPKYGNWMNFIQCARNQEEQNLKALQYNGYLYFESVREVEVGEELLVWYDDLQYDIYMGIPVGHKGKTAGGGDEETVGAGSSRIPREKRHILTHAHTHSQRHGVYHTHTHLQRHNVCSQFSLSLTPYLY